LIHRMSEPGPHDWVVEVQVVRATEDVLAGANA